VQIHSIKVVLTALASYGVASTIHQSVPSAAFRSLSTQATLKSPCSQRLIRVYLSAQRKHSSKRHVGYLQQIDGL